MLPLHSGLPELALLKSFGEKLPAKQGSQIAYPNKVQLAKRGANWRWWHSEH